MLYMYTAKSQDYYTKTKILDVDSYFDIKYKSNFRESIYTTIMKRIDKIEKRIDDVVITPFGATTLENLSSGCKAVLLAVYYSSNKDVLVNITECGYTAIRALFDISTQVDTHVYITGKFPIYEDYICVIDEVKVCSANEIRKNLLY